MEHTCIILLTCNRIKFLKECIKKMEERLTTPYKLIIINNNSKDGTTEYLNELEKTASYPIANIFNEEPPMLSGCYTQGLEYVDSPYFITTQDDVLIPLHKPDVITQLKKLIDNNPRYAAIALRKPYFKAADGKFTPGVTRTRVIGAGFRIHRTAEWKDVGFGNRRWESAATKDGANKMGKVVGVATNLWHGDLGLCENRGYPDWYIKEMDEKSGWNWVKRQATEYKRHKNGPEVDQWTYVPLYMGNNVLGVKEYDKGCGSIFRIQKKSDVEKVGFGKGQMERPHWCKAMKSLGKKVGIIPRESRVTVSEWKNVYGDKGYKNGDNKNTVNWK